MVTIGAAIGSNCIRCVEYHIPIARKTGVTDEQIEEAVELANKVKQVPSTKVYERALEIVSGNQEQTNSPCCGASNENESSTSKCC
jgi:4-carboxymuconolactone decarboxylase